MDREALGKWSCISRVEDRVDRGAIVWRSFTRSVHLGSPVIGKMSCGGRALSTRVELGRVRSGNVGDRDDRVDRIGNGNPPFIKFSCIIDWGAGDAGRTQEDASGVVVVAMDVVWSPLKPTENDN
ncbi:hypothetical protein DPMN_111502 [Dreissena polymorpha]|uniref:Uncharacterized protein n=1 Tax=Dreissena polymorpha TaxID=45954 RepID=A0A9D4QNW0_DREPO|nr:hypothetical protein DPMN_111502 [Dreissena polymorpha]